MIALTIRHVPAQAGLSFDQLESIQKGRIANENTRHQSVMNELGYERKMANQKLTAQLKICTTAKCKAVQRTDELRTQSQLDVQEEQENAAHAKKVAQINQAIAAEEKANAPAPKPPPSTLDRPVPNP
jgi:hypothetical protein